MSIRLSPRFYFHLFHLLKAQPGSLIQAIELFHTATDYGPVTFDLPTTKRILRVIQSHQAPIHISINDTVDIQI